MPSRIEERPFRLAFGGTMTLSLRLSPSMVQKCPLRSNQAGAGSSTSARLTSGLTRYGVWTTEKALLEIAESASSSSGIMPVE